jgi:hypothetical protein
MCHFITVGIPESAFDLLKEAARPNMTAWLCENKYVTVHFDAGYHGYVLTDGHCSCGAYTSPLGDDDETPEELERKRRNKLCRKYEKKGWSEAKIERALADATAAWQRSGRHFFVGLREDVRTALARVANEAGLIYVFAHSYDGDVTSERILVKLGPAVSAEDFGSGDYVLEEDTLVTVKRQVKRWPDSRRHNRA